MLMQNIGQILKWKHCSLSFLFGMCVCLFTCVCLSPCQEEHFLTTFGLCPALPSRRLGLFHFQSCVHYRVSKSSISLRCSICFEKWVDYPVLIIQVPFLFKMPRGCFHQIIDVYAPTPCWRSLSGISWSLMLNLLCPLQPHLSHDLCLILPHGQ